MELLKKTNEKAAEKPADGAGQNYSSRDTYQSSVPKISPNALVFCRRQNAVQLPESFYVRSK